MLTLHGDSATTISEISGRFLFFVPEHSDETDEYQGSMRQEPSLTKSVESTIFMNALSQFERNRVGGYHGLRHLQDDAMNPRA